MNHQSPYNSVDFTIEHTLEQALPQVAGTCMAPEGHRGPGRADREDTSTKKKTYQIQIPSLSYSGEKRRENNRKTYEGRHDPSVWGEPRPHRGLRQRQGGAACRRVPRWPMGLGIWRGDPSCPIHHQSPASANLHSPLPRQGGCQGSAPTVPPTCNV